MELGPLLAGRPRLKSTVAVPKRKAAQLALDQLAATFLDNSIENLLRVLVSRMSSRQIDKARPILNATGKRDRLSNL
jgi:hypothetical protein